MRRVLRQAFTAKYRSRRRLLLYWKVRSNELDLIVSWTIHGRFGRTSFACLNNW